MTGHDSSRVAPFGHLRINTYLAVPRSFSQLIASFIGIVRQGILCVRLSNFLRYLQMQASVSFVQLTSYWYAPELRKEWESDVSSNSRLSYVRYLRKKSGSNCFSLM